MSRPALALVAHDDKKAEMADFVAAHQGTLARFELYATGTTGQRVVERCPALAVTRLKSGPLGGDQQIGALIAEERIDVLIFLVDPLSPHPHDVDVKALTRVCARLRHPDGAEPRHRGADHAELRGRRRRLHHR